MPSPAEPTVREARVSGNVVAWVVYVRHIEFDRSFIMITGNIDICPKQGKHGHLQLAHAKASLGRHARRAANHRVFARWAPKRLHLASAASNAAQETSAKRYTSVSKHCNTRKYHLNINISVVNHVNHLESARLPDADRFAWLRAPAAKCTSPAFACISPAHACLPPAPAQAQRLDAHRHHVPAYRQHMPACRQRPRMPSACLHIASMCLRLPAYRQRLPAYRQRLPAYRQHMPAWSSCSSSLLCHQASKTGTRCPKALHVPLCLVQ